VPLALPIAYLAVFAAALVAVVGVAGALFRRSDGAKRVARRLQALTLDKEVDDGRPAVVRRQKADEFRNPRLEQLHGQARNFLEQADVAWTPNQMAAAGGALIFVLWMIAVAAMLMRDAVTPGRVVAALAASALVPVAAGWIYLTNRRAARLRRIEQQLPVALDIVTRAIRAGHPVIAALQLAAHEMDAPLGAQLSQVIDETAYGSDLREALTALAKRTGSQDVHFFAVSVSIQAETGGSLSEILESLASVIRSRNTLHLRVKSLASEGRASAAILTALPILLIGGIALAKPTFYTDKFSDPVFWPIVGGVAALFCVGQVIMYRITHFKY
jgi:tight adherence protein B